MQANPSSENPSAAASTQDVRGSGLSVSPGSAVGVFNRRMLVILGLSSESAEIVMEEVERGWKDTKRLEWLARNRSIPNEQAQWPTVAPDDLRQSIDAAMSSPNTLDLTRE